MKKYTAYIVAGGENEKPQKFDTEKERDAYCFGFNDCASYLSGDDTFATPEKPIQP